MIKRLLINFDQFGASFQPKITNTLAQNKSIIGVFFSFVIYGLSLAYFIYLLVQWQTNQILPKITSFSKIGLNQKLESKDYFISVQQKIFNYTNIDPFNPKAIILQPTIFFFINGKTLDKEYQAEYETKMNAQGFAILEFKNLSIQLSSLQTEEFPEIEMMMVFGSCREQYLKQGEKCADQNLYNSYFEKQLTNKIIVKQFSKEFNTYSQSLETFSNEAEVIINNGKVFQGFSSIKLSNTEIDDGFLFSNSRDYQYILSHQLTSYYVDQIYYYYVFEQDPFMIFQYKIDKIQEAKQITYSKISEIIADASSILQTLLLISYFVLYINQNLLETEAINQVITIYFPQFKNVEIKKNLLGQIINVQFEGKQLCVKQFTQHYEKFQRIASQKLTILNQIYELSRIQFLQQQKFSRNFIQSSHKFGIPINFLQLQQRTKNDHLMDVNQNNITNQIVPAFSNQELQLFQNGELSRPEQNNDEINCLKQQDISNCNDSGIKIIENQGDENFVQNSIACSFHEEDFDLLLKPEINDNNHQSQISKQQKEQQKIEQSNANDQNLPELIQNQEIEQQQL